MAGALLRAVVWCVFPSSTAVPPAAGKRVVSVCVVYPGAIIGSS